MPGVCMSVCLSVCLSVKLSTIKTTDLREHFTTDVPVDKGQGRTD